MGDHFEITVFNFPIQDADGDADIRNDVAVVEADWVIATDAIGYNLVTPDSITLRPTTPKVAGDTVHVQYTRLAFSNPRNALDPDAVPRPIVKASALSRVTITYSDADPRQDVEAFVDVDNDDPTFSDESPPSGSPVANLDGGLSIKVTDLGSGVDPATIRFFVTAANITDLADADTEGDDANTFIIEGTDVTAAAGVEVTASATKAVVETALGIDLDDVNLAPTIRWWVTAQDNAKNEDISDAAADDPEDAATEGYQPFTVQFDREGPQLDEAFTGDWWDADVEDDEATARNEETLRGDERLRGDRRLAVGQFLPGLSRNTSIAVKFGDKLNQNTVGPEDFLVDGIQPLAADTFADAPFHVFLVLPPLAANASPEVELLGLVTDVAGNPAPLETIRALDGIAPMVTVALTPALGRGDVDIAVVADEAIRTPTSGPRLFVQARDPGTNEALDGLGDPDGVVVDEGVPTRTPGQNEWTFSLAGLDANRYTVIVQVDDSRRNTRAVGEFDPLDRDAITFEVDTTLPDPVTNPPTPGAGEGLPILDFTNHLPLMIDWSIEEDEYPGDSHGRVILTKAELDGEDVSPFASVEGGNVFILTIPDVGPGEHTLVYSGMDEAGNSQEDRTLTFIVVAPRVVGRVFLEGRNNHGGAVITFTGPGGETHRTTSSADGGYGASPPAGTYAVTVERDGFLTARRGGVELPEEGVLELVDVTLLAGDVNGDGKVDAQDLAISGKNAGKDASPWE